MQRNQSPSEQLLCTFGNCEEPQSDEEEFCTAHQSMPTDIAEQITDQDLKQISDAIQEGQSAGMLLRDNKHLDWKLQINIF